jgi:1-acyl-sn-glycerol-3-phosphate acyltransferase
MGVDRNPQIKMVLVSSAAWASGMSVFAFFGSLLLCVSRIVDPKHYDRAVKAACRLIVRCAFIRVRVEGREHLQPESTYLFVGNHVNIFDVFVFYGYISNRFRGIELDEHFDWFFYGRIIRCLGMIPISQTNGRSALKSLKVAQQAMAAGTSILILPEGGRTPNGHLQPFKRGSFILAKSARVQIVPVVMAGAFDIYHKGRRFIRPGTLTLRFGEPIGYAAVRQLDTTQLEDLVRARMLELLGERKSSKT